ncbi:MAG: DUF7694 domain-containing protein [Shimia sp.]
MRSTTDPLCPIQHSITDIADIPSVTSITEFKPIGHLMVEHDGSVTWDELQRVKNAVWGEGARAIEVYPAEMMVVNAASIRHLWRLGYHDWCPDMMGEDNGRDSLHARFARAWAEVGE